MTQKELEDLQSELRTLQAQKQKAQEAEKRMAHKELEHLQSELQTLQAQKQKAQEGKKRAHKELEDLQIQSVRRALQAEKQQVYHYYHWEQGFMVVAVLSIAGLVAVLHCKTGGSREAAPNTQPLLDSGVGQQLLRDSASVLSTVNQTVNQVRCILAHLRGDSWDLVDFPQHPAESSAI